MLADVLPGLQRRLLERLTTVASSLLGGQVMVKMSMQKCLGLANQLPDLAQRRLLERLTTVAASVLGGQVAVSMATLEAIGLLLEVLGEVSHEMVALLQEPLTSKLTGPHAVLRAQVRLHCSSNHCVQNFLTFHCMVRNL